MIKERYHGTENRKIEKINETKSGPKKKKETKICLFKKKIIAIDKLLELLKKIQAWELEF